MQANIIRFLEKKHIVSFSTFADLEMWSAICFYVFDKHNSGLFY